MKAEPYVNARLTSGMYSDRLDPDVEIGLLNSEARLPHLRTLDEGRLNRLFRVDPFLDDRAQRPPSEKRVVTGRPMSSLSASICVAIGLRSLSAFEFHLGGFCLGFQPLACQNGLQLKTDLSQPDRLAVERKRLLDALERTLRFEQPVICFPHLLGNGGSAFG